MKCWNSEKSHFPTCICFYHCYLSSTFYLTFRHQLLYTYFHTLYIFHMHKVHSAQTLRLVDIFVYTMFNLTVVEMYIIQFNSQSVEVRHCNCSFCTHSILILQLSTGIFTVTWRVFSSNNIVVLISFAGYHYMNIPMTWTAICLLKNLDCAYLVEPSH